MKEKEYKPIIFSATALGLLAIAFCGFSRTIRRKIKERDGNRSVLSGATTRLQCAHISHDKNNPKINSVSNGRQLTYREHYLDHYNRHKKNGLSVQDNYSTVKGLYCMLNKRERQGLPHYDTLLETKKGKK